MLELVVSSREGELGNGMRTQETCGFFLAILTHNYKIFFSNAGVKSVESFFL